MKKKPKPIQTSCYTMLLLPTLASIVCGPSMWEISEVLLLYSGLTALIAYSAIDNEIIATICCTLIWVSIFFLPLQFTQKPKVRRAFIVLQTIFSTLNAIVGVMIIGGKYV